MAESQGDNELYNLPKKETQQHTIPVIISDLDGTFLDRSSFEHSQEAFRQCSEKGIPVVFCTSRTVDEVEDYLNKLKARLPFIPENGGAVYIPKGYFDSGWYQKYSPTTDGEYDIITVGSPHSEVIEMLHGLGANPSMPRFDIFSEMDPKKLMEVTGHQTVESAKMSGARKFGDLCVIYPRADETSARAEDIDMFKQEVQKKGFTYSLGGRFHGVNKGADKGKATQIVIDLYKKKFGNVLSIGVGDAHNDLAMLAVTDQSYMVKKLDGSFEPINDPKIQKIDGIGASGWSILANRVISETNTPQNK